VNEKHLSRAFLVLLLVAITTFFLAMIRPFLMAILLAAVFSGLAHPLYQRLLRAFRDRRALASITTILLLLFVVLIPFLGLLGIVAAQALQVAEQVRPWVTEQLENPDHLLQRLEGIPGVEKLEPFREQILQKSGEMVGRTGTFLFNSLSATTRGTVAFFFQLFVLLYTMFFFLMDGDALLRKILYYLPMEETDERRMVEKFVSVTRATIKGTLLIGVVQGSLAGLAFWIVGIDGAIFWGAIMTVLSIIPGIGTALVWVPAAVILIATGKIAHGIFLAAFCGLIVGSVDNILRPRLVGRDTKMHELLILFGTIGGILLFGVLGFIVGPILAALFVTIWEIYGHVFRDALPAVGIGPSGNAGGVTMTSDKVRGDPEVDGRSPEDRTRKNQVRRNAGPDVQDSDIRRPGDRVQRDEGPGPPEV
jgi:predicted PurR-regulated permease PerM